MEEHEIRRIMKDDNKKAISGTRWNKDIRYSFFRATSVTPSIFSMEGILKERKHSFSVCVSSFFYSWGLLMVSTTNPER